jgi:glycosyltransferase involved in cell wall biosynthesis
MFSSTIIPTVGRTTLARAVCSVLDQEFSHDDFEVIVVNDSGHLLPDMDLQNSRHVRVITTNRHERSVARNTGAAIARGTYLHFLDDDDWMAPGAMQGFWDLSRTTDAAWLYGSTQLVNREDKPIIQLRHQLSRNCFIQVIAGEWIPLQASLIETKTFFEVGGFNPKISGPEDIDLLRRIALKSHLSGMSALAAFVMRGKEGTTTDYDSHPEMSRWAREKILDESGVFSRMLASANSDYWRGRILRAYLTSAYWNLQRRNISTSLSRAVFAAAGLGMAGPALLSPDFWRAVKSPYQSPTFASGFREVDQKRSSLENLG